MLLIPCLRWKEKASAQKTNEIANQEEVDVALRVWWLMTNMVLSKTERYKLRHATETNKTPAAPSRFIISNPQLRCCFYILGH